MIARAVSCEAVLVNAEVREEPPIPTVIFASKSRDGRYGILKYSDGTDKEVDLWV